MIKAFAEADTGLSANGDDANPGELRVTNKFYVLTAARHREESWGSESKGYNYFPKWLTEGIGTSGSLPADRYYGNYNGVVTLNELFNYISSVGDNSRMKSASDGKYYYQHVQCYPKGSSYEMFKR